MATDNGYAISPRTDFNSLDDIESCPVLDLPFILFIILIMSPGVTYIYIYTIVLKLCMVLHVKDPINYLYQVQIQ